MKRRILVRTLLPALLTAAVLATAQTPYTPKSPDDPARSAEEAGALAYMRTVVAAQRAYHKKKSAYAPSLATLVGHGSFTKRMARTDRGAYTVRFRSRPNGYILQLTPRELAAERRAFYVDERAAIRVEEEAEATAESPLLK